MREETRVSTDLQVYTASKIYHQTIYNLACPVPSAFQSLSVKSTYASPRGGIHKNLSFFPSLCSVPTLLGQTPSFLKGTLFCLWLWMCVLASTFRMKTGTA